MVRRITLALIVAGLAAGIGQAAELAEAALGKGQGGIDFTPTPFFVQFEGIRVEQPGFRNGDGLVTFEPPSGWTIEGAGAVLKLAPKDAALAMARVETRAVSKVPVDAEESLKSARDYVAGVLPREAQGLKWESEVEKNPVLLNKHETMRQEASYIAFNQNFRATVILCNLADQQLVFVVSGRERDFPKLYEAWRRSLYTWQGLK